jgi:hypothetical protein
VVGRIVTITHEGGHMAVGFLTGGRIKHFYLNRDDPGGATDSGTSGSTDHRYCRRRSPPGWWCCCCSAACALRRCRTSGKV